MKPNQQQFIELITQKVVNNHHYLIQKLIKQIYALERQLIQNFMNQNVPHFLIINLLDAKTCKLLLCLKVIRLLQLSFELKKIGIIAQVSEQVIKLWNLKALQQFEMDGHSGYLIPYAFHKRDCNWCQDQILKLLDGI
ncbi:unnamed protein product [Paramecium octaurelia]|uniref:Uncharacterized protein n=1 Tax=Paramecium octaurelia TaxID=43137 RepID=A0A8S1UE04_PAROT|nr:unnamed protein product [Paramecium octaurelia]